MLNKRLNLHIFGPQGSGKGTQAEILSTKLHLTTISTGQIFRDRIKINDKFASLLKDIIDAGELIPIGIHERIIQDALSKFPKAKGFIFDGAMRNQAQMEMFDKLWPQLNLDDPLLIVLNISDKEAIKRIEHRRTCVNCGNISFVVSSEQSIICSKCQGQMIQRSDDTKDAVEKRLQIYHRDTQPLVDYYLKLNCVINIDGSPAIPEVTKSILTELKKKNIF